MNVRSTMAVWMGRCAGIAVLVFPIASGHAQRNVGSKTADASTGGDPACARNRRWCGRAETLPDFDGSAAVSDPGTEGFIADLEIDAQRRVTNAAFTPKLDAVIEYQLTQDAGNWLFLPPVENGRAVARRMQLPLKL